MLVALQGTGVDGQVALGAVAIIPWASPVQQAWVILHQPIGHLGLSRDHIHRCDLLAGGPALAQGELGDVILDLHLARTAVIKLNGEGGMALYHWGNPTTVHLLILRGHLWGP
jgi:hypothetical protein